MYFNLKKELSLRAVFKKKDSNIIFSPSRRDDEVISVFTKFRRKIRIKKDIGDYFLKTAKTPIDLMEVFQLRYEIFQPITTKGAIDGLDILTKFEIDDYDVACDHVMIIDKKTNQLCGTFRVLCSDYTNNFYSETEFDLTQFKKTIGRKLEIGRFCIKEEFRNGQTLNLLWIALAKYVKKIKPTYLFGCSSVHTTKSSYAFKLYNGLLNEGMISNGFDITPTKEFKIDGVESCKDHISRNAMWRMLPHLLRSYISAGAYIHGEPALDKNFHCIDFFTVLDLRNLNPIFKRKYFKNIKIC